MSSEVRINLLGPFRVFVDDAEIDPDAWPGRRATELAQLLALDENRKLTRDEAIDALWPRLDAEAGGANLRKAAHHARRALGNPSAVELKGGSVSLFPGAIVQTDVAHFESQARAALAGGDAGLCADASTGYTSDLLPEARYEEWARDPRERLRSLQLELLRRSGQLERLLELEPTDEAACVELMRRELGSGRRAAAIRWYGRLRTALRRELGVAPGTEAEALHQRCVEGLEPKEPDLVGRELELAQLISTLRGRDPSLGLVAIRGPAGIGKSALCRELTQLARSEDWCVVGVVATAAGAPYAPLAALVEQAELHDPELLGRLDQRNRAILAKLGHQGEEGEEEVRLTRHLVIGAVRKLLLGCGRGAPVAVIVDDAHLADEATLDALCHLSSGNGTPVLPVLAYRAEPASTALAEGVARLDRAGRVRRLDLEPLDPADTAALVASGAARPRSEEVVERIVALAEGNPFLALEMGRSPVAGVPALVASARDAITARLVDLDESQVEMLRGLALAGDDLDPDTVVALAGGGESEAFELLDTALEAGVLVVSGARYRFRHDLVRQALTDQLAPHRRLAIHRETARRLAEAGAPAALIARHWLDGGRPEPAGPWLLQAARDALRMGAFADALAFLAPLLEHAPAHADALGMRAEALDAIGDGAAPDAYASAARVVGAAAVDDLRAKQALAMVKRGDPPGGLSVLEGIEPATPEGRLAQALALAGAAALGYADPEIGSDRAGAARRYALQTGDRESAAIASWAQAAAAHARGELRESVLADLTETRAIPKLAVSVFDGQLCITQRLLYGARPYPEVIAFADSFVSEARRLGAARGEAFGVTIRGEARLLSGSLDEADADLSAGVELHREIAAATGEAFALQRRSEVAIHRGRAEEATALLEEALAIARESDVGFHLLDRIYGTRLELAVDGDSALAALEEAEAAIRGPHETCPGCRITLAFPAAVAAARAGDLDRLRRWESEMTYLAEVVMRLPAWDAALEEVRGHLARAEGEEPAAADCFRAAAAGFQAAGHPIDEARAAALA